MAAGFELAIGFLILICIGALKMLKGVGLRKVQFVIHVLAPTHAETLVQRTGGCGRDPTSETLGQGVDLARDSVFEGSRTGQKRLPKNIKKGDIPEGTKATTKKKSLNKPPRIKLDESPRKVLDKPFDNSPRTEGYVCSCDNCLCDRGEMTFREQMLADDSSIEEPNEGQGVVSAPEDQEQLDAEDQEPMETKPSKPKVSRSNRAVPQHEAFVDALNEWVDCKYSSSECRWWDITKDWILTEKQIKSISMHPGMLGKEDLKNIKPPWAHYDRWGAEIFQVVEGVSNKLWE
ncbi:hypothetical protein RSAG8_12941, partial [Rhizoctonia solani AG-8 WAC10335]